MPPKTKVTKEELVKAATEVVRRNGAAALNARTVAAEAACSTQPVFSNFSTVEELRVAVLRQADCILKEYIEKETRSGRFPPYKASGMGYIRFAKEEKELFKLLYMCDRRGKETVEEFYIFDDMEARVKNATSLAGQEAELFHMEMWVYVHGIATMLATGFLDLDWDLVSKMITDAYQGLRKQYGLE